MENIRYSLCESFDFSLPRMSAIVLKEDDYDLGFYMPSPDNRIGYHFLDTKQTAYNMDRYTLELYFAAYEFPNLCKMPGKSRFLFSAQEYLPGEIRRSFRLPNSALFGEESLSSAAGRSLTWRFSLRNGSVALPDPTGIYRYDKKLYSLLVSHDGFEAHRDEDGVICISLKSHKYYIASSHPVKISVSSSELDAYEEMGDAFAERFGKGRVLAIETDISIDVGKTEYLTFGMSHHSREDALRALSAKNTAALLDRKWNDWFSSLPTVGFDRASEREKKLYYKAWWTLKLNYCRFPGWGFNVLESLPVYKGIWQWAIPAVEWYSSQDPAHTCEWIKTAMDILVKAQRGDGYITHAAYLHEDNPGEGWMERGIIQNPELPATALRYYNASTDIESLRKWYQPFKKYYGYLCREFDECHENLHLWALHSSYDTGLDTFPAFQEVTYGIDGKEPTEYCYGSILSAERYNYEKAMGELSRILGLNEEAFWLSEAEKTKTAINRYLWDSEKNWYGALQADGRLDTRIGVDGLFPLVRGVANEDRIIAAKPQFERLIGDYGIRTCAEGEEGFFSDIYWRGPCWPKSCSLATAIAEKYYPDLADRVFDSVLNANLRYPNIWECIDAGSGELARSNVGFYCTPCMSSNVGAGELIGAIWCRRGFDMFGTEPSTPLLPMTDYHLGGLLLTVTRIGDAVEITAKPKEQTRNEITFILPDGAKKKIAVTCGESIRI